MEFKPDVFLAALPFVVLMLASGSYAGSIGVYWGQNGAEGSLSQACSSGNYKIVNIGYLSTFGYNQSPKLNLDTHCSQSDHSCKSLNSEINDCQKYGIKVMLSIGDPNGDYALSSPVDATNVAEYLYNNFLSGRSYARPFGDAILDGIDFNVDDHTNRYWSDLATALSKYSTPTRKVYLSASVGCTYPDTDMEAALKTGVFDYVSVRFYDSINCLYISSSLNNLVYTWNQWVSNVNAKQVFLGLIASPLSGLGYITPSELISNVLPRIQTTVKYGGVMIKSRISDVEFDYSTNIKPYA